MEKVIFGIKRSLLVIGVMLMLNSCTNWQYIDTGKSYGEHNMTMWEYFKLDDYNWQLTREMIDHADMREKFEGSTRSMTFIGLTSHCIRKYMMDNEYKKVTDMDKQFCKETLEKFIIPQYILRDDPPRGKYYEKVEGSSTTQVMEGGVKVDCLRGSIWMFSYQQPFNNVPEAGEVSLNFVGLTASKPIQVRVASTNIITNSGVVQALPSNFNLNDQI